MAVVRLAAFYSGQETSSIRFQRRTEGFSPEPQVPAQAGLRTIECRLKKGVQSFKMGQEGHQAVLETARWARSSESRKRDFYVFLASLFISFFGDGIWYVAFPLFVFDLTHSPLWLGVAVAIEYVPTPLFALFAGNVVDASEKKRLLTLLPLLSAVSCVAIAFAIHLPASDRIAAVCLAAFALQSVAQFWEPAFFAALPQIIDGAALLKVNARIEMFRQIAFVCATALGGIVYLRFGAYALANVDAASFALVSLAALTLPKMPASSATASQGFVRGVVVAARWLFARKSMRDTLLTSFLGNASLAILTTCVYVRIRSDFGLSAPFVGYALALYGLGAAAGAAALPFLSRIVPRSGRLISTLFFFDAVACVVAAVSPNIYMFALALSVFAAISAAEAITIISLRQRLAPADMLGRIFAFVRLLVLAGYAPAALIAGALLPRFHAVSVLWVAAGIEVVLALFVRFGSIYREVG